MTPAQQLETYFQGATKQGTTIGTEIETTFVRTDGSPITMQDSQRLLRQLAANSNWDIVETKHDGQFIAVIKDHRGNTLQYELGYTNLELATQPMSGGTLIDCTHEVLDEVYETASQFGLVPQFVPVLTTDQDLLAIPDERDATWVALDGRSALKPLATISSVQFTVPVTIETAIPILNRLGAQIADFLDDYPQEDVWRRYVAESLAGYRADRYGGSLRFESLTDYCERLCEHDMVHGDRLVPVSFVDDSQIDLFLRSVWWYFRLRRHGNQLCIEVRPLPRRGDDQLENQLQQVLTIANG